MSLIVHHLNDSRSQRILWMLEELELPYEIRRYARTASMLAPEALRQVHPLGKSPVLEDDGRTIIESGAIVDYLVEKTGRLGPPPHRDAALRYRQFLHYAEGSLMPPLFLSLVVKKMGLLGRPVRPTMTRMIDTHLDWLETEIAGREWFTGDRLSGADVMMSFPLEAAQSRAGLNDRNHPNLAAWLARIHARPAYGRALEKGGPYRFARG